MRRGYVARLSDSSNLLKYEHDNHLRIIMLI